MTTTKIGDWTDVYTDGDYYRYGAVAVAVGGKDVEIGVTIGVEEYNRETARAAGGVNDAMIAAWYEDSSDWQSADGIGERTAALILEAIYEQRMRLWNEIDN